MIKKYLVTLSFLIAFTFLGFTQSSDYFQQEVNYTIHVKLDDVKHELDADIKIEYINNSPQALHFIYLHLWPNAYKNDHTALAKQLLRMNETKFYYAPPQDRGYIEMTKLRCNGDSVKWEYLKDTIDICKVYLNTPLLPGKSITLTTPFKVKLPSSTFSRLGHLEQSYQISQWYPKPAVFDKNGWHPLPYLSLGEFYSEFGTFDVHITLPENYVVGATGNLVSEEEKKWLAQKVKETEARTEYSDDMTFPLSSEKTKTLHFHQEKIHDFAWFADKRYHVLKGEMFLPNSQRKVDTWLMFTNKGAYYWKKGLGYMKDALFSYSKWIGDYPYDQMTVVDGSIIAGGGMEYPNVTVINTPQNDMELETVMVHEIGHNWFYGILASNERDNPWMDEGLNSYFEYRTLYTKYPRSTFLSILGFQKPISFFDLSHYNLKHYHYFTYVYFAAKGEDQAPNLHSTEFTTGNYAGMIYSKTACGLNYLSAYLGQALFDSCMQQYYETWRFKHPQPNDLRLIFETVSKKNLSWFFDEYLGTTKKIDYRIASAKNNSVVIKNKGQLESPVSITGYRKNNPVPDIVWIDGFKGKKQVTLPGTDYYRFKIDAEEIIPEVNRNTNHYNRNKLFKKASSVRLQFLGSIDHPEKEQIFFCPVLGWNSYNKWMPGIALYNNLFPQKKWEYLLVPMYSTNTQDIAGHAAITGNFFPTKSPVQSYIFSLSLSRYAYGIYDYALNFNRIAPELIIKPRKKSATSTLENTIRLRSVYLTEDFIHWDTTGSINTYALANEKSLINEFTYLLKNKRIIDPFSVSATLQQNKSFIKTWMEGNYSITFKGRNRSFDIRGFAGTFLLANRDAPWYSFKASGFEGSQDYLYDHIFLARSSGKGLLSQQFMMADGGMKIYTPYGRTTKWLAGINLKTNLPGAIPFKLFADFVTYADAKTELEGQSFLFDAGICITLYKDVFEVYLPIKISKKTQEFFTLNNTSYLEQVRFVLNLKTLNPLYQIKHFSI